jgi:hypothetical protein
MRQLFLLLSLVFLTMCESCNEAPSMLYDLSSAKDAFEYPNFHNESDTDIYVYQLRDTLNRHDSFIYVNYGSHYLNQFEEKNLSLRPLPLETFRFTYNPFGGRPINITFNRKEIIIKLWKSGQLEPFYNENKLDSLEAIKFRYMEQNFFRSREFSSGRWLKYYDSMEAKYPELKSIKYYKDLINKCTDYDSLKFEYTTKRIPLSDSQYASLIDSLKLSNFDNISWKIEYPESIMDGGGYTFEANTRTKFKYFVCYGLPIDSLPMTKFCRYLLQVAKVDKDFNL